MIDPIEFSEPMTADKLPSFPNFYYAGRGGYAIEHNGGYIPLTAEAQVRQHLMDAGLPGESVSRHLCRIRTENFVSYIGPVAGHHPGIHTAPDSGESFLVTTGPRIIEGKAGTFPFISAFLSELLDSDPSHPDQLPAAVAWLRQARTNVIRGKRRPLPVAVLVGPRNCGKSLFIDFARLCLGGRAASAYPALSGQSNFNADVLGPELLVIDDEIASHDHRMRTALAQGIKKHLFAGFMRVEPKFRHPVNMRPVHAVIIAVNDEAEHLQVLPTIDESLIDKVSLFWCSKADLGGLDDRDEIAGRIEAQLPAFLHNLESTNTPEHLRDTRTGARAWQHPRVIEELSSISPEEQLRTLLCQCFTIAQAIEHEGEWRGTAAEVEQLLLEGDTTKHSARKLLTWPAACGTYLGRLMDSGRAAIERGASRGVTRWTIISLEPAEGVGV